MFLTLSGILDYNKFKILSKWDFIYREAFKKACTWKKEHSLKKMHFWSADDLKGLTDDQLDAVFTTLEKYSMRFLDEELFPKFGELFFLLEDVPDIIVRGSKYLLFACRYIQEKNLEKVKKTKCFSEETDGGALIALLLRSKPKSREEVEEVIPELKKFGEETLLLCGCLAYYCRHSFEKALAMDGFGEFLNFLYGLATFSPPEQDETTDYFHFRNNLTDPLKIDVSSDPDSGFIDRQRLLACVDSLGEKNVERILETFRNRIKVGRVETLFLIEAALGRNKKEVMERFEKRSQIAVKALGAFPGKDDVRKRYEIIKKYAEEAKQFGAMRSTHEKAAARVALRNLAQVAGYDDEVRLEWALGINADIVSNLVPMEFKAGEYRCRFDIDDSNPVLKVEKDGKPISSVPAAIKSSADYKRIKDASKIIRKLAMKYRKIFEETLSSGEWMTRDELDSLKKDPIARQLLSRLVVLDEKNGMDLMDFNKPFGKVRLAHPFELLKVGKLVEAQKLILAKGIRQPFKQVFRELYVITPAEKQTGTFSNRFAGIVVDGGKSIALMTQRGWSFAYQQDPVKFLRKGFRATLSFSDMLDYFCDGKIDALSFERREANRFRQVKLEDVDPLVFSETMRDVDLFVSVAGISEDKVASTATMAMRADLVRRIADVSGLDNVIVLEKDAKIKGKLAEYRVHLGSGNVYLGDTQYLCIVPAGAGKKIFLPFEDEDAKSAEIVSKMFLLAGDDKIKDKTILDQIKKFTGK